MTPLTPDCPVGKRLSASTTIHFAPHSNESLLMPALMKFLHVLAAIAWLGGISFMLFALRPAAAEMLTPPQRLPLIAQTLQRFFALVWVTICILLLTGLAMLLGVGMKNVPIGWHLMFGIGLLMFALFGHLYFGPFRRLKKAVSTSDWPEGGRRVGQIATLALVNLALGVLAIAAVFFLR
jgi:uncharacterized membrane protein